MTSFRKDLFGRYIIVNDDTDTAWSGSRWVPYDAVNPMPLDVQICNFNTEIEAKQYARKHGLLAGDRLWVWYVTTIGMALLCAFWSSKFRK